ncbi:MAG: hypothetical protein ABIF09_17415, partial [Gemmatimonadota bacterium]
MFTDDQFYDMYLAGQINYWDYAFLSAIINVNYTVAYAITYADTAAPGGVITPRGRALAVQILTEQGRTDQISDLPGG